jgi:hypothetical protein
MNKEQKFSRFYDLLYKAIPKIGSKYMKFEAVGLMDGFMERTYTYEFYHQLRRFQDELKYNDFTIHAEPEKARTEFLHNILRRLEGEKIENENINDFQKRVMPDLLVHVPGIINENVAIVEIKPEKKEINSGIRKDIRVLKEFINGGDYIDGYYKGIFLLYATANGYRETEKIKEHYSRIIKDTIGDSWRNYSRDIILFWHPKPGAEPIVISWA